jgi:hypothetical protein
MKDVDLQIRISLLFMHDGDRRHFLLTYHAFLINLSPEQFAGRGGPIASPALSPDLNPLDVYLRRRLKV